MAFKRGVSFYARAVVEIGFPEGRVSCDFCPLMETYSRKQCRRTGEYLADTRTAVGYYCPLIIQDDEPIIKEEDGNV